MTIWIDAHLPAQIAPWIATTCQAVRELGLRDADDPDIFDAARKADAVVMSKDADFCDLLERLGPPPRVIWITCGNTSNARLKTILADALPKALHLLKSGEALVEITG